VSFSPAIIRKIVFQQSSNKVAKRTIFHRFSLCFLLCFLFTPPSSFIDEKYSGCRHNCNKYNVIGGKIFALCFIARTTKCNARSSRNRKYILPGARTPSLLFPTFVRFADRDHESSAEASSSFCLRSVFFFRRRFSSQPIRTKPRS